MEYAIEIARLSVTLGKKNILHDLTLSIPKGQITAIIGPNGCGKSTLLRAMCRILTPQEGTVTIHGRDMTSLGRKSLARHIAILPQLHHTPDDITVRELVQMGRFPYRSLYRTTSQEDKKYVDKALYAVRLDTRADELMQHLSGGEQQRAWLALLLAQRASILCLDEPTTYLDIHHQVRMMRLLRHINEKTKLTIVIVLHDMNQALRYADHVIAMNDGAVYAAGVPQEVITPPLVRRLFHVEADVVTTRDGKTALIPIGLDEEGQHGNLRHKKW